MYEIPPIINNNLALNTIKLNKELRSKTINQPIARYNNRDMISNLPVRKIFLKVPKKDKVSKAKKILSLNSYIVLLNTQGRMNLKLDNKYLYGLKP